MRHQIPHISVSDDALPNCSKCGTKLTFTRMADIPRDGKVYFLFRCTNPACDAGESKVWRPEWQAIADTLVADEL